MPRRRRIPTLPDPTIQPTISVPEAGRLLNLSRDSAYKAARSGEIPTQRFGRLLRVPTKVFLEMLGYSPSSHQ